MLTSCPRVGRDPEDQDAGSDQSRGGPRGTSPGIGQPFGAHGTNLIVVENGPGKLLEIEPLIFELNIMSQVEFEVIRDVPKGDELVNASI